VVLFSLLVGVLQTFRQAGRVMLLLACWSASPGEHENTMRGGCVRVCHSYALTLEWRVYSRQGQSALCPAGMRLPDAMRRVRQGPAQRVPTGAAR